MTVLCYGLSIGWTSPAAPALQLQPPPLGGDSALTDEQISWLGSLQFLGGLVGVLFTGKVAEKFGRKICGYLISIPILVGWITILMAQNYIWLYVGKFSMGFGGAGSMVLIPLYVSETAEDSYRGALVSFINTFLNLGILLAYFLGSVMSLKNMTLFSTFFPIIFVICYFFLPESPVFLMVKGNKTEALKSLMWLRSGNREVVDKELAMLDSLVSSSKSSVPISRLYENKGTIKAMIISFALFYFQLFCGIVMILTYTSLILIQSEMDFSPHSATAIIGLIRLIASWGASFIMDRIDRKVLLVISNLGMAVSLLIIGLFFYLQKNTEENILPNWTPFVFICIHMIFYVLSGPMPFIITSETLMPEIRPLAFSVTVFWGTAMTFTSVKIYTTLVDNFHMYGNFWFFAFWCVIAAAFAIIYVPETRGKSLIEIINELNGGKDVIVPARNKTDYSEIPIRESEEAV